MSALFEQGFFVRVPAWHGLGVVLADYPGRAEAMALAGHDFDVIEVDELRMGIPNDTLAAAGQDTNPNGAGVLRKVPGWKVHVRSDNLATLHVSRESFHRIPNSVAYDFAELLLGEGFRYETGITLKGGALCALTLLLDEPIQISGDDSEILPYVGIDWAHDGTAALGINPTSVRRVCANTVGASIAEGERLGRRISIRHTAGWRARVEDAKRVLGGVRDEAEATRALGEELAGYYFTEESVYEWIERFTIPAEVAVQALTSSRVKANAETARRQVTSLWQGPTVPEAHKGTGYGLYMAATEYLDHTRRTRGSDARTRSEALVQRTLLKPNAAKAGALKLIRDMVAEGEARKAGAIG